MQRFAHHFVNQTIVQIPGILHRLQTSHIVILAYADGPPVVPIREVAITIDPTTYDVQLSFHCYTLRPDLPEGFTDDWLPPQTGTALLFSA